jgi:hypothetical protein
VVPIGVNVRKRGEMAAMSNDENGVFFADSFHDLGPMAPQIVDYLLEGTGVMFDQYSMVV